MNDQAIAAAELLNRDYIPDTDPNTRAQFAAYVRLVLQVCPDCLTRRRGDGAWIFVPPHRDGERTRKNLSTVWPRTVGLRVKIIPANISEYYRTDRQGAYLSGLARCLEELERV